MLLVLFADGAIPEHGWPQHDQQEPAPRGVHSEESGLPDEGHGTGAVTPNSGRRRRRCDRPQNVDLVVSVIL